MVAGELVFAVGHKGGLVRAHGADEVHQVLGGVAFDVVLALRPCLHEFCQLVYVVRANVALVGAGVYGNAVCASLQAQSGGACNAGYAYVACVA